MQDVHSEGLSKAVLARMAWPSSSKVLDFYEGIFDAAYVCLLPFIRPGRLSPLRFRTADYPGREELLREAQPVAWADVLALTGFA